MTSETLFLLIVGVLVFDFVFNLLLDVLNYRHRKTAIPEELQGIYNDEQYRKQQEYKKVNTRFGFITDVFSFVVLMSFLLSGGFSWLDGIVRSFTEHPILMALLFFGILMFASDILSTPFAVYQTFVIEERFGFNKTTPGTYVLDKIKGWLLGTIIGGGLLALIFLIYMHFPETFWIYAWIVITAFSVFMMLFYSNLIVPLFNKQTPLAEGTLRVAIVGFIHKAGFKLKNVFVIDGSKRSTKANAYFTGIGPKKRIVLYDTLINDLETGEIVAVLAHETGHYKKKHILISLILSVVQTGITLYILSVFISNPLLSAALGVAQHSFHVGLVAFGILYSPISFFVGIFMNLHSRKAEYEADRYVVKFNLAGELISGLKKLTRKNLSNLAPHPLYVFFHYSHPTLLQRVKALKEED